MSTGQIYHRAIAERKNQNRYRKLRSFATTSGAEISINEATTLINFASNDYLGLSQHPQLKSKAIEYIEKYGAGLGSSRLLSGNLDVYDNLERKVAAFKGTETALLLPTGFQTNATVIAALSQNQTHILSDHENHNSIIQGLKSGTGSWQRYRHNDLNHLELRLKDVPVAKTETWIVTESVFSMDGDIVDIDGLDKLSTTFGANVYLDEAHATGVLGQDGRGLSFQASVCSPPQDSAHHLDAIIPHSQAIIMGTFSKAMGSFGAYVACSHMMRDYLINYCSGLIYSTALPPAVLGSIDAALDLVPTLNCQREQLLEMSAGVRTKLKKMGFETGKSSTQIIPIIVGDDAQALSLASYLKENSILAPAIRPPTVPNSASRIRLSLTVLHRPEHIEHLLQCLGRWAAHD